MGRTDRRPFPNFLFVVPVYFGYVQVNALLHFEVVMRDIRKRRRTAQSNDNYLIFGLVCTVPLPLKWAVPLSTC